MTTSVRVRTAGSAAILTKYATPAGAYAPLKIAVGWMGGTFLTFLLLGQRNEVTNMVTLVAFVAATMVVFTVGYVISVHRLTSADGAPLTRGEFTEAETRSARTWIALGAVFYALYGLSSLASYGLANPVSILQSVLSPGSSYFVRLRAAEALVDQGSTSTVVQVTTLLAVLATPVVPFLVLYWPARLGMGPRLVAIAGVMTYAAFWLAVGTLKGLGDLVLFAAVAALVVAKGTWPRSLVRVNKKQVVAAAVLGLLFGGYMVVNQGQRLVAGGISGYQGNPVVASVLGENTARGLAVTLVYPTHGYLGLSKNLETPFEWSQMRGSSRVVDSYLEQYLGSASKYDTSYPARTEQRTGYPALMYWSTIYPWLASDITFPGAILFMGVVGWWLARFWIEGAFLRRRLSVLMFAQLAILIAYVPANNQIGLMRPGFIAFVSLCGVYFLVSLHRWASRHVGPNDPYDRQTPRDRML